MKTWNKEFLDEQLELFEDFIPQIETREQEIVFPW